MSVDQSVITAVSAGFLLGLGFIFSIGPQNLRLIESGAIRENAKAVATIGYLSEMAIVVGGLIGLGSFLQQSPHLTVGLRAFGIAFLTWYALHSFARRNRINPLPGPTVGTSRGRAIASMLAVTWFNPLVYVEIGLLVGVMASSFAGARWWFGAGFLTASAIRFYGWTYAGGMVGSWLTSTRGARIFGTVSGSLLLCSAVILFSQVAGEL